MTARMQHDLLRERLWLETWASRARACEPGEPNVNIVREITSWADAAVAQFDAKFPAPAGSE